MKTYKLIEHYPIYHIDSEEKWEIVENVFVNKLDLDNPTEEEIVNILIDHFLINRKEKDEIIIEFHPDMIRVFEKRYKRPIATFYSEEANDEWKEKLFIEYAIHECLLENGDVSNHNYIENVGIIGANKNVILRALQHLIPENVDVEVEVLEHRCINIYDKNTFKPLLFLVPVNPNVDDLD